MSKAVYGPDLMFVTFIIRDFRERKHCYIKRCEIEPIYQRSMHIFLVV